MTFGSWPRWPWWPPSGRHLKRILLASMGGYLPPFIFATIASYPITSPCGEGVQSCGHLLNRLRIRNAPLESTKKKSNPRCHCLWVSSGCQRPLYVGRVLSGVANKQCIFTQAVLAVSAAPTATANLSTCRPSLPRSEPKRNYYVRRMRWRFTSHV